jgi:serine/threonine-protein kinase
MSPEQARGEEATPASDLYSFGVMLQEIFTGRRPYPEGLDYLRLLDRVQKGDTLPVSGVGSDLAALITRLKSPNAAQRPTAVDVTERLRWIREAPKRRLRAVVLAAAVAIAMLGAIKYTVDLARERTAAVLARQDADRRRDQAEALIGYMLGDLRGKLRQVGRLELLDDVGKKAIDYFEAVPAETLSTEELFRRSQAMHQLGQIRQERGDLAGAMPAYRESLLLAGTVAARDPDNSEWQVGLATAHFYVGDGLRRQGDLDGAMREFSAYRDVAQRLVARDPQNVQWLLELSYGHSNVAAVLEARGDLTASARELQASLALKEQIAQRDPARREWQQALATGHNRLGVVLDKLGQGGESLGHFVKDLDIRRKLVAAAPRDNSIKRHLLVAHSYVALAQEDLGEAQAALGQLDEAIEVGRELVSIDPANADWRRELAVIEARSGALQRLTGNRRAAREHCQRSVDTLRPLAEASPTHVARQRDLANALICLGTIQLDEGVVRGAEATTGAAARTIAPLIARRVDPDLAPVAAASHLLAGLVAERLGNAVEAQRQREQAVQVASSGGSNTPDKRHLAARARALIALHRVEEARPIVATLTSLGYRQPVLVQEWSRATAAARPR